MNLRWLWLDHVPPGVDLSAGQQRELRRRSRQLRASHPRTMHKHGSLIGSIIVWSFAEAALLLMVVLWLFPMAASLGPAARYGVIIGLPLLICVPFWIMIATAFNRSHSPFVRQALNEMGHAVCMHCGYALRGLGENVKRCPECGTERVAVNQD